MFFCSWKSDYEKEQVSLKKKAFDAIWGNKESGIKVIAAPEVTQVFIKKIPKALTCKLQN